jgi:hypothetical protein
LLDAAAAARTAHALAATSERTLTARTTGVADVLYRLMRQQVSNLKPRRVGRRSRSHRRPEGRWCRGGTARRRSSLVRPSCAQFAQPNERSAAGPAERARALRSHRRSRPRHRLREPLPHPPPEVARELHSTRHLGSSGAEGGPPHAARPLGTGPRPPEYLLTDAPPYARE